MDDSIRYFANSYTVAIFQIWDFFFCISKLNVHRGVVQQILYHIYEQQIVWYRGYALAATKMNSLYHKQKYQLVPVGRTR